MKARALLALAAALLAGCSASGSDTKVASTTNGTLPEPTACDAGTRPALDGSCAAVGPGAPADGFALAADGWGLDAVRPAKACTGATAARLGSSACVPIDDCTAAFPPAGASVVLHDGDSLPDAIASAPDGATIALDRGTYAGFAVSGRSVKVIGRCASDVVIKGTSGSGVSALGKGALGLASVTVSGFDNGASVDGATGDFQRVFFSANGAGVRADHAATVHVAESVVDGTGRGGTDPIRALLAFHGSKLDATALDVRALDRAFTAYDPNSVLDVTRSIAVASATSSQDFLLMAMLRGAVRVHGSYLATTQEPVLIAGQSTRYKDSGGPAEVLVEDCVVEQKGGYQAGSLMAAMGGGTLSLLRSTVRSQSELALHAFEARSRIVLEDSVVTMSPAGLPKGADLFALNALEGASAEITRSAIVGARGVGVAAFGDGSRLTLDGSLVSGTTASSTTDGTDTFAVLADVGATASLKDSVLTGNEGVALTASGGSSLAVESTFIDDTRTTSDGSLGEAIVVTEDASLAMQGSVIRGAADVALVVMRAKGHVQDTRIIGCSVGVNTWESTLRKTGDEPADREVLLEGVTYERTATPEQEGEMTFRLPVAPAESL